MMKRNCIAVFVLLTVVNCNGFSQDAGGVVLRTSGDIYPSPAAVWTFSRETGQLNAIEAGGSLLSNPGGLRFRIDNPKQDALINKGRIRSHSSHELIVDYVVPKHLLDISATITSGKDMLLWKVAYRNTSDREVWVHSVLELPLSFQKDARTWDGWDDHQPGKTFNRPYAWTGFPVAYSYDGKMGIAYGLANDIRVSHIENGKTPDGTNMFGFRLVVPAGATYTMTFVTFLAAPEFGFLNAVDGYFKRFPETCGPNPNVDPRITDPGRTDCAIHYYGVMEGDRAQSNAELYAGTDWHYTPYKRPGDYYGHEELWNLPLDEKRTEKAVADWERRKLDFHDRKAFLEQRKAYWDWSDTIGNIVMGFYHNDYIDMEIVKANHWESYLYPENRRRKPSGIEDGWAVPYAVAGHFFPWATPYERVIRRDMPLLVKNLNLAMIAHDLFMYEATIQTRFANGLKYEEAIFYRGPLDYDLQGWSYDDKGKFMSRQRAFSEIGRYFKTLTNDNGYVLALWANGHISWDMRGMGVVDAFLSELRPHYYLDPALRRDLLQASCFSGSKSIRHHGFANSIWFAENINWKIMKPGAIKNCVDDYLRDLLVFFYQAGYTPSADLTKYYEHFLHHLPIMRDVFLRGAQPVPGVKGEALFERRRYGSGIGAAVVTSSRLLKAQRSRETAYPGHFDGSLALPVGYEGESIPFSMTHGRTDYDLTVRPVENKIVLFPVGLAAPDGFQASGKGALRDTLDARIYSFEVETAKACSVSLLAKPDPEFRGTSLAVNGKKIQAGQRIVLTAGMNRIEFTTASELIQSDAQALLQVDYSTAEVTNEAGADPRMSGTATLLKAFIRNREKLKEDPQGTGRKIILSVNPKKPSGVSLSGKTLTINGPSSFQTQQNAWLFMRWLDRHKKTYNAMLPRLRTTRLVDSNTKAMFQHAGMLNEYVAIRPPPDTRTPWHSNAILNPVRK